MFLVTGDIVFYCVMYSRYLFEITVLHMSAHLLYLMICEIFWKIELNTLRERYLTQQFPPRINLPLLRKTQHGT